LDSQAAVKMHEDLVKQQESAETELASVHKSIQEKTTAEKNPSRRPRTT